MSATHKWAIIIGGFVYLAFAYIAMPSPPSIQMVVDYTDTNMKSLHTCRGSAIIGLVSISCRAIRFSAITNYLICRLENGATRGRDELDRVVLA